MRRRARLTAAVSAACAAVLIAAVPSAATGGATGLRNGIRSGVGAYEPDPYFPLAGNPGYDVQHYDLDLDFTPATHALVAQATITARAEDDLPRFTLDYSGPAIERIQVDGRPAAFRQDGQELTVVPHDPLARGREFTVRVDYRGTPGPLDDPALGVYGWINTDDGAVALNEPDGARTWYPVNDDIRDKATYTFRITVPEGVTALANGERQSERRAAGRTTATWAMNRPMSSYLAMVAIGKFRVDRGTVGGIPDITAVDPAGDGNLAALQTGTAAAVAFGERHFGRYPFGSVGGIVDRIGVDYALETQSRPVYDGRPDELTMVHEIAHQWYGDSVTPTTWRDIWLNEGFATYAEWLWQEEHGGPTAAETFDRLYATPAGDPFWELRTADPGRDDIFDYEAVYLRGAMFLQELRRTLGDPAFFELLHTWAERHRYGSVATCDLRQDAERIAGRDLGPLFHTWLYTETKPALTALAPH
ncbi:M1 family metallopeptidase [Kitasatospora camelliae]|uniref:Aminopeptidase N n=1 Tax=Kitasatospora camelliae TaxID=3156397 RepID=A0AAU8K4M7_9ACTN